MQNAPDPKPPAPSPKSLNLKLAPETLNPDPPPPHFLMFEGAWPLALALAADDAVARLTRFA